MSIEFRRRSAAEFVQILRHRKWQIVLPALAVFIAIAWEVRSLPNVYQSTTLLTLSPQKISEKVSPSLSDEDLSQRLQSINQIVLSRSSLEPMLAQYNLFEDEKAAGVPIELIVERMKNQIVVEPDKADNYKVVGFRISFRGNTPEIARNVTAELADKYVSTQTVESTQSAETTREFIDNNLSKAKENLDALEKQRLNIMAQNVEALPESGQGLIAQLGGLRQREQSISKDKETLILEKGRIHESVRALNSQMRLVETFGEKETQAAVNQATRVEDTPAYGQLIQKRAEFSAKLENLKNQYRDKHPDIIQTQTEINKINDELERLARNTDRRAMQANQAGLQKAELQAKSLEIEREKAESQLGRIDQQLQAKDKEMLENSLQINALEAKINLIPNVKVALEGIDNQYSSAKAQYDELLKKFNNAQQQVQLENEAQGESIRVVDPANLPQTPVNASKKPLFLGLGAGIGLALGLLLAAVFEVPRWLKILNIEDTEYYTGLPVLASVPPLLSDKEIKSKNRIYRLNVLVGVIAACGSVPLLVTALDRSRIFERLI